MGLKTTKKEKYKKTPVLYARVHRNEGKSNKRTVITFKENIKRSHWKREKKKKLFTHTQIKQSRLHPVKP